MKLTVQDIADIAGVSKATVSRVINNSPLVSMDMRIKIEKIMQEHDYRPSLLAQSFSKSETSAIAVIVPQIQNPHFAQVLSGITAVADRNDLTVLCGNTTESTEKELKLLETFAGFRVKGLILAPCLEYSNAEYEALQKILWEYKGKVVIIDRDLKQTDLSKVLFDDTKATYDATKFLLSQGYGQIFCLNGPRDSAQAQTRAEGYRKALLEQGVSAGHLEKNIRYGKFTVESGYEMTHDIISQRVEKTAFLTCSNDISLGFLRAVQELNYSLPESAWVAVDRLPTLEDLGIKINYTFRDALLLGTKAADLLLEICNEETEVYPRCTLDVPLIIGGYPGIPIEPDKVLKTG